MDCEVQTRGGEGDGLVADEEVPHLAGLGEREEEGAGREGGSGRDIFHALCSLAGSRIHTLCVPLPSPPLPPPPPLPLQPIQVKSAIAVEGLKGYIYVEAYKQTHVKHVRTHPVPHPLTLGGEHVPLLRVPLSNVLYMAGTYFSRIYV